METASFSLRRRPIRRDRTASGVGEWALIETIGGKGEEKGSVWADDVGWASVYGGGSRRWVKQQITKIIINKITSLSCKRPSTFKLKLNNSKPNIEKSIGSIVIRLIFFGD